MFSGIQNIPPINTQLLANPENRRSVIKHFMLPCTIYHTEIVKVNANKNDIRFIRTETAITEAFIDLVSEIGFYAISVKDITARADVSRGTFYQHYDDKHSLLNAFEEKIKADLLSALTPGRIPFKTDAVKERVIRLFTYCEENLTVMRALFGKKGDAEFQQRMKDLLWNEVFSQHINYAGLARKFSVPEDYLREYVNSSHYRVFQTWLEKDQRETPEEMTEIYLKLSVISPLNKS